MAPSCPLPSPESRSHVSPSGFETVGKATVGRSRRSARSTEGVGKCREPRRGTRDWAPGLGGRGGKRSRFSWQGGCPRDSLGVGPGAQWRARRGRGGERAQGRRRGGSSKVAPKFPAWGAAP